MHTSQVVRQAGTNLRFQKHGQEVSARSHEAIAPVPFLQYRLDIDLVSPIFRCDMILVLIDYWKWNWGAVVHKKSFSVLI